jgi:hypothetical protein
MCCGCCCCRDILSGLLKEGPRGIKHSAASDASTTSRAVASVTTQLPLALEVYFDSLPRCAPGAHLPLISSPLYFSYCFLLFAHHFPPVAVAVAVL